MTGMRKLCLVSCIFSRAQDYVNEIPQQRLVFLVQHLVGELEASIPSFPVARGQIMVILSFVLPAVKEIYGPFWLAIIEEIQRVDAQADLYVLHASLRLLNILRRSYMLESNDDLLDAWSEKKAGIAKHLVDLLGQLEGKSSAISVCLEALCFYNSCDSTSVNSVNGDVGEFSPLLTV